MTSTTLKVAVVVVVALIAAGCSGSGRTRVSYGVGYGGYYGGGPWRGYHGYPPVYVGGGGGYPDIPDGPSAAQMPDFGMPDMGGFDF
jgi:hypothetical protein